MFIEPILIVAMILTFMLSFWTGFTDAAYAISTVIGTRTLKPIQAVGMATVANFVGMSFGTAVAFTIGTGIIAPEIASGEVIIAALVGALIFDVIASWIFSLPISETHVLVGGLVGAGFASAGIEAINVFGIFSKVIIPMVTVPPIAIVLVFFLTLFILFIFKRFTATAANKRFRKLQIVSAFFFSMTDGTNDAQKIMGIATILLVYYGYLSEFVVPLWVIITSYSTLSLGTFLGGWRIVKTMATKITKLRPYQGFAAETGSAMILGTAALTGLPVSSTHAAGGAIMGVGLAHRRKAVKWGTTREIAAGWILSLPLAALFAYLTFHLMMFIL
jgi:PiT family inorganic phosphate transporter